MNKPVILTGLRANNDLHIGNYFGALLPIIDMAKSRAAVYQINLFVPDLHSFTTPIDHGQLQNNIMHNLRLFAAAGLPLDHPDIYVYRQSYVPAHSELTWILDCFTGFGEMSRMTQFKDKGGPSFSKNNSIELNKRLQANLKSLVLDQNILNRVMATVKNTVTSYSHDSKNVSVGLFNYPVLMAADYLLYGATYVPVGDDQTQHLEYGRDIAQRMNNQFGELFVVPKPVKEQHEFFGKDQGLRIKDLIDPTKKMSKSDDSGRGVIFLGDDPETAAKKIMGATTDSFGEIRFDFEQRPGISNLLQIFSLFAARPLHKVIDEWQGKTNYGELKSIVAEATKTFLSEFQTRLSQVDDEQLLAKLAADEKAMNAAANQTLYRVQQAVGLRSKD